MYSIIVTNYGNFMVMNSIPWSLSGGLMSFFAIRTTVQAFYTYRLYAISRHLWLAVTLWVFELLELCLEVGLVILLAACGEFLVFKERYNGLVYVALLFYRGTSSSMIAVDKTLRV
jgi:hypothetical protein